MPRRGHGHAEPDHPRNLRLVVSIAKRCLAGRDAFFELVSDGNISLFRAVEKFDFARGYAFGTYAAWAIVNGFARSTLTDYRRRERFRTNHGETVVSAVDRRHGQDAREAEQCQRPAQVAVILEASTGGSGRSSCDASGCAAAASR